MSIIDEKLAKEFLVNPDDVDLSEATKITDGAAEALSKHEGYLALSILAPSSGAPAHDNPRNVLCPRPQIFATL